MGRRATALLAGLWLVAFGVLGTRHEAQVAHVVDRGGEVHHAPHLAGTHTGPCSDIHRTDADGDVGACAISATLHQAARASLATPLAVAAPPCATVAAVTPRHTSSSIALLYRLAPKTSPPHAAS
jgi:hypothetical protein